MSEPSVFVAVLTLELFIPHAQSLKDKRQILKSIKEHVRGKYNVSIAEINFHDKWQRARLGLSMLGNDKTHIEACLQSIVNWTADDPRYELTGHQVEYL